MATTLQDKKFLANSLLLSATGLRTSATVSKAINDYGYLSYMAEKTKGDVKIAEAINNLDERAIAQNAASDSAEVQKAFKQVAGKQATAIAGAGIDSGSGYANDLLLDSAKQADKDMSAILYNAQSAIDKKRLELKLKKIEADSDIARLKIQQESTLTAGVINSAVTLFDGIGTVASKWLEKTTPTTSTAKE